MSECELPEFYTYTTPVARKAHRCCECSAPIQPGEKHFHAIGKWPGDGVVSYRQHLACEEACELIRDEFNGSECIGFGFLKESFGDIKWQIRHDKTSEPCKRLRSLMANILWRERSTHDRH